MFIYTRKNKGLLAVLIAVCLFGSYFRVQESKAADKYIKVEDFIKYIVQQMEWAVDENSDRPYIDAAIKEGILKKNDFKDYSAYLTRTDAAVIANRLDELVHQKCGYPEDVYEFLRGCTLFENKLYYCTDGKFYPEGATKETYPAIRFLEEVVLPIFEKTFKDKDWPSTGLRAGYKYIYDDQGNIVKRYMIVGVRPDNEGNFVGIDPFDKDSDIIKAWNTIIDYERKLNAVLEKRISDINSIPKSKREAVAAIVAKGIIKGYSNGTYATNREFRGSKKITADGAKDVIQKVLHPELRALISPDGQLIRTTKLPKNAGDYRYILESFPNKYYEMNFAFTYLTDYINGTIRDDEYAYPKDTDYDYLYNKFYHDQINSVEIGKYDLYDQALSNVEKYLQLIFNVDYRTVNDKWKKSLESCFCFNVGESIDKYISYVKKNHVVVEFDKIAIDPGAVYESRGRIVVRAYVRYRVTADNVNNVDSEQLIYSSIIKTIKNGEWREDIFDIYAEYKSNNYVYKWGPAAFGIINNWAYRDSFK